MSIVSEFTEFDEGLNPDSRRDLIVKSMTLIGALGGAIAAVILLSTRPEGKDGRALVGLVVGLAVFVALRPILHRRRAALKGEAFVSPTPAKGAGYGRGGGSIPYSAIRSLALYQDRRNRVGVIDLATPWTISIFRANSSAREKFLEQLSGRTGIKLNHSRADYLEAPLKSLQTQRETSRGVQPTDNAREPPSESRLTFELVGRLQKRVKLVRSPTASHEYPLVLSASGITILGQRPEPLVFRPVVIRRVLDLRQWIAVEIYDPQVGLDSHAAVMVKCMDSPDRKALLEALSRFAEVVTPADLVFLRDHLRIRRIYALGS